MTDAITATLVVLIWFALGLASAAYLGRHGRRHPAWYIIGLALGPIMLPIALEMAPRGSMLLDRTGERSVPATAGPRRTVLVAVDGSPESEAALREAVRDLPEETRFVLLTVMDPDLRDDRVARARAEELLAECSERLPRHGVEAVVETAAGNPAEVIVDRALAEEADLIVMGRRGHGLSQRLLGSVADQVVRRSPMPVLLGREHASARPRRIGA